MDCGGEQVCACACVRVCWGGGGSCVIPPYTAIQAKEESTPGLCELPLVVINNTEIPVQDLAIITRVAHTPPVLASLSHAAYAITDTVDLLFL